MRFILENKPEMDQRDHRMPAFGICDRLYNFFASRLASYALKTVTLGHPLDRAPDVETMLNAGPDTNKTVHLEEMHQYKDLPIQEIDSGKGEGEMLGNVQRAKAPKKMVSINEAVEEIKLSKKKSRRMRSSEKVASIEYEIDEAKPLKSILKVSSSLKDDSDMDQSSGVNAS